MAQTSSVPFHYLIRQFPRLLVYRYERLTTYMVAHPTSVRAPIKQCGQKTVLDILSHS